MVVYGYAGTCVYACAYEREVEGQGRKERDGERVRERGRGDKGQRTPWNFISHLNFEMVYLTGPQLA